MFRFLFSSVTVNMLHVDKTRHLRTLSQAFGNTDQHFFHLFFGERSQSTVTIIVSLIFICSVVIKSFETKESILDDIILYKCCRKIHLYHVFVFLNSLIWLLKYSTLISSS